MKSRVIPLKQVWNDRIRWILHAEHTNMCISLRNNDIFSKKRRFSCISPTKQDILGMIDGNALKTRVIPPKLSSIDRILWTLQTKHKNMWVSVRNNDLFTKKRRFLCILQTDNDILDTIVDNSLKPRYLPSKHVSTDNIRWLYKQNTRTCVFLWEIMIYARKNVDFSAFRRRNTILWVWLMITLWKLLLFL